MLKLATVVWGVKEFEVAIRFWVAALDYVPKWKPDGNRFCVIDGSEAGPEWW